MSISTVVSRGYGSFSDVNELPTRGYTIGAALAVTVIPLTLQNRDIDLTVDSRPTGLTLRARDIDLTLKDER